MKPRGFFAIGVFHPKTEVNIGTLWRHAYLFGAALCFTVGTRYRKQSSDTQHAMNHIPLMHFASLEDLIEHLPQACPLVAVELSERSKPLAGVHHDERACYLLGAEDHGLPPEVITRAHRCIQIECPMPQSMNVAAAGTLIMYDRYIKSLPKAAKP